MTDGHDGAGFVIRGPDSGFIMADGSHLFETTIPAAEFTGHMRGHILCETAAPS